MGDIQTEVEEEERTDFFVVGNSKSGTSALHEFLDRHPEICMSSPKEPNVFATDFCHDVDVGAFQRKCWTAYRNCFDDRSGNRLWGESSACYLYSKDAALNIHDFNSEAKIIAIFREPVSFLYSYHLQQLENVRSEGESVKDFEKAIKLETKRKQGKKIPKGCLIPELLYYSERVKYAKHLKRFTDLFPGDNIKTYIYDDFKKDNKYVYKDILKFLNLDVDFNPRYEKKNTGKKLKSKKAQNIIYKMSHGKGDWSFVHKFIKATFPKSVRRSMMRKVYDNIVFKPKGTVSPDLRTRLMKRFKPEVKRFSDLIGRDMVREWNYDSI